MEHTIAAPKDGEVTELLYAPGDQIAEGAELLKLASTSGYENRFLLHQYQSRTLARRFYTGLARR